MKTIQLLAIASALIPVIIPETHGQITQTYTVSGLNSEIADNSPFPAVSTQNISDLSGLYVSNIKVSLTLSGGSIGDIFAILTHNGSTVALLNRLGRGDTTLQAELQPFGYINPGLNNITFSDSAANGDIHLFGQKLTALESDPAIQNNPVLSSKIQSEIFGDTALSSTWGTWQPDGRTDPNFSTAADSRTSSLSNFNYSTPNGIWNLQLYDNSQTYTTYLNAWSLEITAVPEPQVYALLSSMGLVAFGFYRRCLKK